MHFGPPSAVGCPSSGWPPSGSSRPWPLPWRRRESGTILTWPWVRETVQHAVTWWRDQGAEVLIVEGVGGFLCPLAEGATVADLAIVLDLPIVVVARRGLGTLNHTLLTVEAIRLRGLRIAGIVLNGSEPTIDPRAEATNPLELARRLEGVPILAEVPFQDDSSHHAIGHTLIGDVSGVNWYKWAQPSRALPVTAADRPRPSEELTHDVS